MPATSTTFGIIRQSDGYISCSSEPGKGTTFTILLPRTFEARDPAAASPERTSSFRGHETILLVEDDDMVRRLTQTLLEKNGYSVLVAAGGGEAIEEMQSRGGDIDLLVTDVVMPRMNGDELFSRLLPLSPTLKVLFMSGHTGNAALERGKQSAGVDFLLQPFSAEDFLATIRKILDRE